jgi:uncharacterized damage-inducible protein DinB
MPGLVRPVADERDGLLAFLAHQREAVRLSVHGLGDGEARLAPGPGPVTLGGLIRHVTAVERSWTGTVLGRRVGSAGGGGDDFLMSPDQTLAEVLDRYREAAEATDAAMAGQPDLGRPVPIPQARWAPRGVEAWSVRWVLLHLIAETARHAGHADRIREALDGATALPLMAAVEGWPSNSWMTPWTPGPASQLTD